MKGEKRLHRGKERWRVLESRKGKRRLLSERHMVSLRKSDGAIYLSAPIEGRVAVKRSWRDRQGLDHTRSHKLW